MSPIANSNYPVGRDKILRTLQYFSRFLAWYLYRTNRPQSAIAPFDATKKQFGATRKLLRVGKFVEHFRAAAVASDAKTLDPVLRVTTIGRQLGYAFYMLFDNACVVRRRLDTGAESAGRKVECVKAIGPMT